MTPIVANSCEPSGSTRVAHRRLQQHSCPQPQTRWTSSRGHHSRCRWRKGNHPAKSPEGASRVTLGCIAMMIDLDSVAARFYIQYLNSWLVGRPLPACNCAGIARNIPESHFRITFPVRLRSKVSDPRPHGVVQTEDGYIVGVGKPLL